MSGYEFGSDEDETIAVLAAAMQNVGVLSLIAGLSVIVNELAVNALLFHMGFHSIAVMSAIAAVLQLVIAGMLIGGGRLLMAVPRTEGEDIPNLIAGLRKLGTIYLLQAIVTVAAIVMCGLLLGMVS